MPVRQLLTTRSAVAGLLVVVLLGIGACSDSDQDGTSVAARTAAAVSSSSSTTTSTTPTTETLGVDGKAWFDTFCTGLSGLQTAMVAVATPTGFDVSTPVAYQAGLAQAYYTAAGAFAALGTTLAATPAPSFEGGAEFATEISGTLTSVGGTLRGQVDAFAATPVVDLASVDAANQALAAAVQTTVGQLGTELTAVADLPSEIRSDVIDLPSCAILAP